MDADLRRHDDLVTTGESFFSPVGVAIGSVLADEDVAGDSAVADNSVGRTFEADRSQRDLAAGRIGAEFCFRLEQPGRVTVGELILAQCFKLCLVGGAQSFPLGRNRLRDPGLSNRVYHCCIPGGNFAGLVTHRSNASIDADQYWPMASS